MQLSNFTWVAKNLIDSAKIQFNYNEYRKVFDLYCKALDTKINDNEVFTDLKDLSHFLDKKVIELEDDAEHTANQTEKNSLKSEAYKLKKLSNEIVQKIN